MGFAPTPGVGYLTGETSTNHYFVSTVGGYGSPTAGDTFTFAPDAGARAIGS